MRLTIIVAMAENRVIGRDGGLPWHLPADLKRFRRLTMGHAIILGRRTYQSIGRPLPGRRMIVLSGDPGFQPPEATVVPSLSAAIEAAGDDEEIFIVGGAQLYEQALPQADRMLITRVQATIPGDTFFPEFDEDQWELVDQQAYPADREPYAYAFEEYRRRKPPHPARA